MESRGDFPGDSVVKTLSFHCRGCEFNPWLGEFPMPRGAAKNKKKKESEESHLGLGH